MIPRFESARQRASFPAAANRQHRAHWVRFNHNGTKEIRSSCSAQPGARAVDFPYPHGLNLMFACQKKAGESCARLDEKRHRTTAQQLPATLLCPVGHVYIGERRAYVHKGTLYVHLCSSQTLRRLQPSCHEADCRFMYAKKYVSYTEASSYTACRQ